LKKTKGIHHISAIVGHPQENIDFYTRVLGLRLVKRTVNFDDPGTYHFYFGDEKGTPGTIITFFPWPNAKYKGRIGGGQVGVTSYVIPFGAMRFWENRLKEFFIPYKKSARFGEQYLQFVDPHGLHLELVERNEGKRNEWSVDGITSEVAIKGFGGALLLSTDPERTSEMLYKVLGLDFVGEDEDYIRFRSLDDLGNIIDIKKDPVPQGRMGVGTVHHIAWRADEQMDQAQWKKLIESDGYQVTDVKDRNYFHSVYFREPGEILFEIATDVPGFLIDEPCDHLGEELKLPPQFKHLRGKIEAGLLPIEVPVAIKND
jgi:glyoxalase family protein